MQFWPRKRSSHSLARVRSWAKESKAKLEGFIGYKAGMTHLMAVDNRPKALTKGEQIFMPATIIECPPITVCGVSFYKKNMAGSVKIASILAQKTDKHLSKQFPVPKKSGKGIDDIKGFDFIRVLVHSNPAATSIGTKKPKLIEIAVGGNKDDQIRLAKELLGKEVKSSEVFTAGNYVDVHGITKGKGFQGTVKRYGVPVRQHKAEKTKRGIATLGGWTPKRIEFSVPIPGKMGYHLRTEYNKQIIKMSADANEVNQPGGINHYGILKNSYLLVKGSVVGPKRRAVLLTQAIRQNKKAIKDAPEITYLHK